MKANYRKHTRTLRPRGMVTSHRLGHAHAGYGVGFYVSDTAERDRPFVVSVTRVEDARTIIDMMSAFIASMGRTA